MRRVASLALALAALVPSVASAHPGVGDPVGLTYGFLHPLTGLDHVLAMVMVGMLAWQLGGRALWLVPGAFVALMAVGGMLGVTGIGVPFVEAGIALSVIVLGAVLALGIRPSVAVAMALVGLFAIFHGHAHGSEMPESAAGFAYGLGFMLATAALHTAGIGLGCLIGWAGEQKGPIVARATGAAAAVAGVAILAGIA